MEISTEVQVLVMDKGKVLIGHYKGIKNDTCNGKWETPGGVIRVGEHIVDAAIREVFEHVGITVDPQNVLFVSEVIDLEQDRHRILIYIYAKYVDGDITIREDKPIWTESQWIDVRKLGDIQDEMSNESVDAFYKFSLILQQVSMRSGAA